jgi:hypothetical protein
MYRNSTQGLSITDRIRHSSIKPGAIFLSIILVALLAFEIFNYSTTQYALSDVLGSLTFLGLKWATILSIAFCGIDFAGIARLFTPGKGAKEPNEVWYLFGAWFLAATMNAILTWWGVSMALDNHQLQSQAILDPTTLTKGVPIFVAVMVWLIRIMIIGSLSMAGDRMLNQPVKQTQTSNSSSSGRVLTPSTTTNHQVTPTPTPSPSFQSIRRQAIPNNNGSNRMSMSANRAEPIYTEDDNTNDATVIRPTLVHQNLSGNQPTSSGARKF